MTEEEMRDSKVPTLNDCAELGDYVRDLIEQEHDYGTCVYAMSMAATAAYNLVASKLGVTGFQARCADMDIIKRTRGLERFMIVDLTNALYPQYDMHGRLREALDDMRPWLKEEATKLLADNSELANVNVVEHWRKLAAWEPK